MITALPVIDYLPLIKKNKTAINTFDPFEEINEAHY